jgi:hypothetical protein
MMKKMDDNQAKTEADRKADREKLKFMIEEMNASQKDMLAKMERMTNANQAKTDTKLRQLTETIEKKNADGITDSRSVSPRANKETPG